MSAPRGAEQYVGMAMEFAAWAAMSDEERTNAAADARAVEISLAATRRMTALCDYALCGSTPQSAPAVLSDGAVMERRSLLAASGAVPERAASAFGNDGRASSRDGRASGSLQPSDSSSPLLRAASQASSRSALPPRSAWTAPRAQNDGGALRTVMPAERAGSATPSASRHVDDASAPLAERGGAWHREPAAPGVTTPGPCADGWGAHATPAVARFLVWKHGRRRDIHARGM